jgi:hypothetical protein
MKEEYDDTAGRSWFNICTFHLERNKGNIK